MSGERSCSHDQQWQAPFDPKVFLAKVNGGRAISDYRKDQIVYRQGEAADSVFYIQSGKVKATVVSEQGKEAVVALLGTDDFLWRRVFGRTAVASVNCLCNDAVPDPIIAKISQETLAEMIGTTRSR